MDYKEAVEYLYSQTPQFCQIGAAAYKPGLDTVRRLDAAFGRPHAAYPTIHIAGTNGKGSTAHTLAAVLQSTGLKVGLYTSPHLVDFRERIRVNGEMISEKAVTGFLEGYLDRHLGLEPSFFELATVMAFDHFAREGVDVAVIEVGLGGRLDSTNIITPVLSVITNISLDHMAQLGSTTAAIASEKAGIIKPGVPVVVGEADVATLPVFSARAHEVGAPLTVASAEIDTATPLFSSLLSLFSLKGPYQRRNLATILAAVGELRRLGFDISEEALHRGLAGVETLTGLRGRWMKVADLPLTICDTGHNIGGWQYLAPQLDSHPGPLWMVIGFVNDKDISHILPLMPRRARYVYTRASVPRALPAEELQRRAVAAGLPEGTAVPCVADAVRLAQSEALAYEPAEKGGDGTPLVFVGGSTFVVADLLGDGVDWEAR